MVASNAKVDFKMDYLVIRNLEETRRVHISEIAILILESTAISITAYAIFELIERKGKIIFCDKQRNPFAEIFPSSGCHDSSARIRQQIHWPPETKDNVCAYRYGRAFFCRIAL